MSITLKFIFFFPILLFTFGHIQKGGSVQCILVSIWSVSLYTAVVVLCLSCSLEWEKVIKGNCSREDAGVFIMAEAGHREPSLERLGRVS